MNKRISITLNQECLTKLDELATADHRKRASMATLLLEREIEKKYEQLKEGK